MTTILDLNATSFTSEVLHSPIPVLVDFWAPWCAPCRMMAPVLEKLAQDFEGKIKITKLNVDLPEHQALAYHYRIQGIPNLQLFKQGKVVKEFIGLQDERAFAQQLTRLLTE